MKKLWWTVVALVAVVAAVGGALWWANLNLAPQPGGYVSMTQGVEFYPACGNETLSHDGTTWYQIQRDDWDTPSAHAAPAWGGKGIAMAAAIVAPPGLGDDVGTLYVYRGGRAFWRSDSGHLTAWLTVVPQTYGYVC